MVMPKSPYVNTIGMLGDSNTLELRISDPDGGSWCHILDITNGKVSEDPSQCNDGIFVWLESDIMPVNITSITVQNVAAGVYSSKIQLVYKNTKTLSPHARAINKKKAIPISLVGVRARAPSTFLKYFQKKKGKSGKNTKNTGK